MELKAEVELEKPIALGKTTIVDVILMPLDKRAREAGRIATT